MKITTEILHPAFEDYLLLDTFLSDQTLSTVKLSTET